jgi:4,5-DOPA dioxygenase extradiol
MQPASTANDARGRYVPKIRRDMRAPSVFLSFGSPLAMRDDGYAQALRRFGIALRPPRGIIVATANWRTVRPLRVTASRHPETYHDYGDFPSWLDKLSYRCPGSPGLASEIVDRLADAGISAVQDMRQGLDYSAWMPISLVFPTPRVPVVQISLPAGGAPDDVMAVGRAVATLRRSGYLILGSGGTVFNLHRASFDRPGATPEPWARAFDDWIGQRLEALDTTAIVDYRRLGPYAHLSAPTPDHLDPLFFALGAGLPGDRCTQIYEGFHAGSVSLRSCVMAGRRKDDLRLPDELVGTA